MKAAYDKIVADFKPATEWNAAHILVDTEDKAKALKAEIDGGADFADVAKANSKDGSAASGGDLGWFGAGQMVPEFETAVQGMQKGQVSDPVKTQFGWHLVKLIDTRETAAPTIDEARPQIENELKQQALQAKLAELRAVAKVDIPEDTVPPAAIRDSAAPDQLRPTMAGPRPRRPCRRSLLRRLPGPADRGWRAVRRGRGGGALRGPARRDAGGDRAGGLDCRGLHQVRHPRRPGARLRGEARGAGLAAPPGTVDLQSW